MKFDVIGYREWARDLAEVTGGHHHGVFNPCSDARAIFLAGWSQMVPEWSYRERDVFVIHPSPLPLYRGGSPIQHQIMDGQDWSAVSIFKLEEGYPALDSGRLAFQQSFRLNRWDGDLADVLIEIKTAAHDGIAHIMANIDNLQLWNQLSAFGALEMLHHRQRRTPAQSEITPAELATMTARQLHDKVRALQDPYPNAFIRTADGGKLYITKTHHEEAE